MRGKAREDTMFRAVSLYAWKFGQDVVDVLREDDIINLVLRMAALDVVMDEEDKQAQNRQQM